MPPPAVRSLKRSDGRVDPSFGKNVGNSTTVHVPWETLSPGPTGHKIAVIDYCPSNGCYYPPVNLDDPLLLANDGFDPTEADPRFHQKWSRDCLPHYPDV